MNGGGVFGALIFVVGILIAFAILFGFFLIVPFFVFLAGIVVMLVSDRRDRRSANGSDEGNGNGDSPAGAHQTVEVVETTTKVRET